MTSTIKVNNVQNQCGQNIINENSNTITIGASGDTIALASGASQTGFGRTGTVDWQTSIKTATFTAVSGEGYFCNTSGGAFTVNLPSSPSVGDIVAIKDYASSFDTQNLTIGRGGSNMNGTAADSVRDTENESLTLVYADATKGWLAVEEGTGYVGEKFIVATGGTITCSGDYKIHTFTGPGTFCVSCAGNSAGSNSVDYLVIAGAGGGGADAGGGGGAGGYRESSGAASGCYTRSPLGACVSALPVSATAFPVTVGSGGASNGTGSNSVFSTITSAGGGQGSGNPSGKDGGSGGGGRFLIAAGSGNTPPVSPPQGNNGGNSIPPSGSFGGGGGGGATAVGAISAPGAAGNGGAGATSCITASPVARAGGGGGGGGNCNPSAGSGVNGGGNGANKNAGNGTAGTANTGGGGGGGGEGTAPKCGGAGGSGIVIIRYKFQ